MNTPELFERTEEMLESAAAVLTAMAYRDTVADVVTGYQRRALNEMGLEKWPTEQAYQLSNEDWETYSTLCLAYRKAAKLSMENPNHCPLLVAENNLRLAKKALVDVMASTTGLTWDALRTTLKIDYVVDIILHMLTPKLEYKHFKLGLEGF